MAHIINNDQFNDLFYRRQYPKDTKARIIPYYVINNQLYFLLCEEYFKYKHVNGIYNIIGGHRENKETIIECIVRELYEESLNTVNININLLKKELILKRNKRYIIFMPIIDDIASIIPLFEFRRSIPQNEDCFKEIKQLKWLSEREIFTNKVYRSVVDILLNIKMADDTPIAPNKYFQLLKQVYLDFATNYCFPNFYALPNKYIITEHKLISRHKDITTTS